MINFDETVAKAIKDVQTTIKDGTRTEGSIDGVLISEIEVLLQKLNQSLDLNENENIKLNKQELEQKFSILLKKINPSSNNS